MSRDEFIESLSVEKYSKEQGKRIRIILKEIIEEKCSKKSSLYRFINMPRFKIVELLVLKYLKDYGVKEINKKNKEQVKELIKKLSSKEDFFTIWEDFLEMHYEKQHWSGDWIKMKFLFYARKNKEGKDEFLISRENQFQHIGGGEERYEQLYSEVQIYNDSGIQIETRCILPIKRENNKTIFKGYRIRRNSNDLYTLIVEEYDNEGIKYRGLYPELKVKKSKEMEILLGKSNGVENYNYKINIKFNDKAKTKSSIIELPEGINPMLIPGIKTIKKEIKKEEKEKNGKKERKKNHAKRLESDCKKYPLLKKSIRSMELIQEHR